MALPLKAMLTAAAICLSHVSAYAQSVKLTEVRLLGPPGAPAESAVFELINDTDGTIRLVAVSCQLLDETGRTVAVKGVRFRNIPPGSIIGDAAFPAHVRGTDVTCRILHQTRENAR
jgi:hypothetical protein